MRERRRYHDKPICESQIPFSEEDFYSVPTELKKNPFETINRKHTWWKRSRLVKSLNSFLTYQLASFASLIWPDIADKTMYETLKEQFEPQQ